MGKGERSVVPLSPRPGGADSLEPESGGLERGAVGRVAQGWGAHQRKGGRLTDGHPPTAGPLEWRVLWPWLGPLADPSPPGLTATC